MGKLGILARLALLKLPEPLAGRIYGRALRVVDGRRIDPRAQILGEIAAALRGPGLPSVAESRAQMARLAARLDEPCPPGVRREDIALPGAEGPRAARVYRPEGAAGVMPTLFYLHGGGWIQCDLDTHDGLCGKLAAWAGIQVLSYDYRLAPEHKFPAGLEDALAAWRALAAEPAGHGIDPGRFAIGGDSAGGNLAAAVIHELQAAGAALPAAQLLIYPALDGRLQSGSVRSLHDAFLLGRDRIDWYLDLYLPEGQDRLDPRVSPMLSPHLAGQPPALIVIAGHDPLRDDGAGYAARLRAAGGAAELVEFPGQIHAFMSLTKVLPQGNAAIRRAAHWLRETLA